MSNRIFLKELMSNDDDFHVLKVISSPTLHRHTYQLVNILYCSRWNTEQVLLLKPTSYGFSTHCLAVLDVFPCKWCSCVTLLYWSLAMYCIRDVWYVLYSWRRCFLYVGFRNKQSSKFQLNHDIWFVCFSLKIVLYKNLFLLPCSWIGISIW